VGDAVRGPSQIESLDGRDAARDREVEAVIAPGAEQVGRPQEPSELLGELRARRTSEERLLAQLDVERRARRQRPLGRDDQLEGLARSDAVGDPVDELVAAAAFAIAMTARAPTLGV